MIITRNNFRNHKLLSILVVSLFVLVVILRFSFLDSLPAILNRDEAALAYNSFLLLQTGKDEWARSWPLTPQSFGDFKLIGYMLATTLSFMIFGFHDFAVRLPSAFSGLILITTTYYFAHKVLKFSTSWSLSSAVIIAFTPIFFFYSRIAFEANMGLSLLAASLTLLFGEFKRRKVVDAVGALLFLLAICTYNTPLLLLPFVVVALIFWRGATTVKKWILPVCILSIVFLSGMYLFTASTGQKKGITLFSDQLTWKASVDYRASFESAFTRALLGNRVVFFAREIGARTVSSLLPDFLVIKGGNHPWHTAHGTAHIYWVEYLFLILGVFFTLKKRSRECLLILFFLVVGLAPAVVTVDAPHATRSLFFFWMIVFICLWGARELWAASRKSQFVQKLIGVLVVVLFVFEAGTYFYRFFVLFPGQTRDLMPEYKTMVGKVESLLQEQGRSDEMVAVEDGSGYLYILTAWYIKLPPSEYFASVIKQQPDRIGLRYGERVGRYHFIDHAQANDFNQGLYTGEKILIWRDDNMKLQLKGL